MKTHKQDESFGMIPLVKRQGRWEVFLIQHRRGGYWGFPKGHKEPNETPFEAAARELKEETNLVCIRLLHQVPLEEKYSFHLEGKRVDKRVLYFIAEVEGEVCLQPEEINAGQWFALPEAMDRLTHAEGRVILTEVSQILPKLESL